MFDPPFEDVDEGWNRDRPITEYTDRDLTDSRTRTLTLDPETTEWGRDGTMRRVAALMDVTGLDSSAVLDHAVRIYLADRDDARDDLQLRDDADVGVTIPPTGWVVGEFDAYDCMMEGDVSEDDVNLSQDGRWHVSTTPAVYDMVHRLLDDEGTEVETQSDVLAAALRRVCGVYG
jgi:hypothetical protein